MGCGKRLKRRRRFGGGRPVKPGDVFDRLSVICDSGKRSTAGSILWSCVCECGNSVEVTGAPLKRGDYRSCGCWTKDRMRTKPPGRTHGGSGTGAYRSWATMRRRCRDKAFKDYEAYGGSGVVIDESWQDFASFLRDMGERPDGYTLDRIDSTGDYTPSNCRWASRRVQGNNTSRNHLITYQGKTQTMAQWAREVGMPYSRLRARLNMLKWPIDKALGRGEHE